MIIFGVDISSFVNKVFHSVHMSSFNFQVQASHLKKTRNRLNPGKLLPILNTSMLIYSWKNSKLTIHTTESRRNQSIDKIKIVKSVCYKTQTACKDDNLYWSMPAHIQLMF